MDDSRLTPAERFARMARGFCTWCEAEVSDTDPDRVAAAWLAALYAAALALPEVDFAAADDLPVRPADAPRHAESNVSCFRQRYYRICFNPNPAGEDAQVLGDLEDDLRDICEDLQEGLLFYERGETDAAIWHWRFSHRIHWGRHAVGALTALHGLSISQQE